MRTKTGSWTQYLRNENDCWTRCCEHRRSIRTPERQRRQEALLQQLVEMNERSRRENDPTLN